MEDSLEESRKIVVLIDWDDNNYRNATYELICKGRELAEQCKGQLIGVGIGAFTSRDEKILHEYGLDTVIIYHSIRATSYWSYSDCLEEVIRLYKPVLVMFTDSQMCRAVSATIATKVGAGLTAECIEISINQEGKFIFRRTAMGHSSIAEIECVNTQIQMCTVKSHAFSVSKGSKSKLFEVNRYSEPLVRNRISECIELLDYTPRGNLGIINDLQTSAIILAAGRGVEENDIEQLKKIAEYYSAGLGGTRVLVERGLISKERQIGQSGIIVKPALYVAFGISGSSQHIVGFQGAKTVIAINRDANAPIFKYADYKIVEDTHKVIWSISEQIFKNKK